MSRQNHEIKCERLFTIFRAIAAPLVATSLQEIGKSELCSLVHIKKFFFDKTKIKIFPSVGGQNMLAKISVLSIVRKQTLMISYLVCINTCIQAQ